MAEELEEIMQSLVPQTTSVTGSDDESTSSDDSGTDILSLLQNVLFNSESLPDPVRELTATETTESNQTTQTTEMETQSGLNNSIRDFVSMLLADESFIQELLDQL